MQDRKFRRLIRKINFYPPYLGMGVRVRSVSADMNRFEVVLRQRWYNRNLFGTHFGGALYSMSDPFYVFIAILNLGSDYIVWDKSAAIRFLKPASGTITGVFEIDRETLQRMKRDVDERGKNTYHFETDLLNEAGEAVARVTKEIYVRAKNPA